jgi:glutamate/tyrosine decarboxylase-like PLP-dependent enzyme
MMGAALQTSLFLVRHPGLLAQTNGTRATYLFQPDKMFTEFDTGDKTIQCGRKTDGLKMWYLWKKRGDAGMAASVEKCFHLAAYLVSRIRVAGDAWRIVVTPSCTNVCFWYVPKRLRPFKPETASDEEKKEMHAIAPKIKKCMQERGMALIGFQTDNFVQHGDTNFFRMVVAAADIMEEADMDKVMEQIDEVGCEL